ncbi:MAG: hypothetical protein JNM11_10300, partial [Chitinimonas sp.]|nr:hypothetical protein [Chitinimonas sp.]
WPGVTAVASAALGAIVKFDSPEAPHAVYCEIVCQRVGRLFHVPLADGVLTATADGPAYASLEVCLPGVATPDLPQSRRVEVAKRYPNEVAALLAFDILIGNNDRACNVKAVTISPHIHCFAGFDHSHTLLNIESTIDACLARLSSNDLIVGNHPFLKLVNKELLHSWAARIAAVDTGLLSACCTFNRAFRGVDEQRQLDLAKALVRRQQKLPELVHQVPC